MRTPASDLILARLQTLHPKSIDLSLGRIERLLAALGHPERQLPPVVHIAGTNGKGSTLAMLDAMLAASGLRVHRYISPHLVRFAERILIHGEPIDEARLEDALARAERANDGAPITFFEITTAAAFLAFLDVPADIVLLETGLGGRLDATNVLAEPRLTLITPVSMDHERFLGDRIELIAFEKAGILKPGVPAAIGPQTPAGQEVIERRAAEIGAPLLLHGRDWQARLEEGALLVEDRGTRLRLPPPRLEGVHQIDNAGLAVVAARALGDLAPGEAAIAAGLGSAFWPARLQRLHRGPLVDLLPPGVTLTLDGGHNPAAGEVLARTYGSRGAAAPRLHLITGMLQTHDLGNFLRPLAALARSVRTVAVPGEPASRSAEEAAAVAGSVGLDAAPAASVGAALADLLATVRPPAEILICGSLYLAGHVLAENG